MTIVGAWLGGIASGSLLTLGLIHLATGRAVLKWGTYASWSQGEIRVAGLAMTIYSLFLAAYLLAGSFVLSTGSGPGWRAPAWYEAIQGLNFLVLFSMLTTNLLLEQHHRHRWPFTRPRPPQTT